MFLFGMFDYRVLMSCRSSCSRWWNINKIFLLHLWWWTGRHNHNISVQCAVCSVNHIVLIDKSRGIRHNLFIVWYVCGGEYGNFIVILPPPSKSMAGVVVACSGFTYAICCVVWLIDSIIYTMRLRQRDDSAFFSAYTGLLWSCTSIIFVQWNFHPAV